MNSIRGQTSLDGRTYNERQSKSAGIIKGDGLIETNSSLSGRRGIEKLIPPLKIFFHIIHLLLNYYPEQETIIEATDKSLKEIRFDRRIIAAIILTIIIINHIKYKPKLSQKNAIALRIYLSRKEILFDKMRDPGSLIEEEIEIVAVELLELNTPSPEERADLKKWAQNIKRETFLDMFGLLLNKKYRQGFSPSGYFICKGIKSFINNSIKQKKFKECFNKPQDIDSDITQKSKDFVRLFVNGLQDIDMFGMIEYYKEDTLEAYNWFKKNFKKELLTNIDFGETAEQQKRSTKAKSFKR